MIENIVARAKKKAVKRLIENKERGIKLSDLHEAVREEFKENEDLPNTTNPDDWARISGRKGERIINVRTLMTGISRKERYHRERRLGAVPLGRGLEGCGERMAIPKVMGTEIEYGITIQNDRDFDPISSCVLLVNAYREDHTGTILWDYDQENPLADARGFQVDGEKYTPNQQENIARNKTLVNGARYYVDHAHPEYSCPEVTNPRELVVHEKAGERIVEISRREANTLLPAGTQMLIYKNNSDRKGNSYGCHENYLMDRRTSFKQIVEHLMPFFVSRQVYTGAGKVGTENRAHPCDYQLSQRSDFYETEVALDTMVKRPIINTRDEPHADREKYRRLHVIVGDSNMAEPTIYLRNGATAIVLAMIEDGAITAISRSATRCARSRRSRTTRPAARPWSCRPAGS